MKVGIIREDAIHIRLIFLLSKYYTGYFSSSISWRYMTYGEAVGAGSTKFSEAIAAFT